MSQPLALGPEAQADVTAARGWYEQQRAGLGDEFVDAFDESLDRITTMPEPHPDVWNGVREGGAVR